MAPRLSKSQLSEAEELAHELKRRRAAREDLLKYTQYVFPKFQVNWHHERIAELLTKVLNGEIKRLMINMPPRHGKSEMCSVRFPAFAIGRNPQLQVIHSSYGVSLSETFSDSVRTSMKAKEHQILFKSAFAKDSSTSWMLQGKQNGRPNWISAGAGGGISGQGADLLIIDDPVKNQEEAASVTMREKVWLWWLQTARTRLQPGGAVIVIMTRWHEDDLAGKLLAQAKIDPEADQWVVLNLPAVNTIEEGLVEGLPIYRALWPKAYDHYWMAGTKASSGPSTWNALYQGKPKAPDGNLIKKTDFRFWQPKGIDLGPVTMMTGDGPLEIVPTTLPESFEEQLQSWDMTFKETKDTDFVVGGVWGRVGANKYLLDVRRERMDFGKSKQAVIDMRAKWPETWQILIEDKANGPAIISSLRDDISGIIPVEPTGSKEARLQAASWDYKSGNVFVPHPKLFGWVLDYIDELCGFPFATFDDQADMSSQAINHLRTQGGGYYAFLNQLFKIKENAVEDLKRKEQEDYKRERELSAGVNDFVATMEALYGK